MKVKPVLAMLAMSMVVFAHSPAAEEKRFSVPIGDSPVIGPATAPVTIIEFLDFQ